MHPQLWFEIVFPGRKECVHYMSKYGIFNMRLTSECPSPKCMLKSMTTYNLMYYEIHSRHSPSSITEV